MLRQLLTLLAVISGFTLAAEPVSAADARVVSIAAAHQADCAIVAAAPVQQVRDARSSDAPLAAPRALPPAFALAPSVRIKVDHTRE